MNWKGLPYTKIMCWVGLFMLAYYPPVPGFLEAVGYKLPFVLLASGAGSDVAKTLKDKFMGGNKT